MDHFNCHTRGDAAAVLQHGISMKNRLCRMVLTLRSPSSLRRAPTSVSRCRFRARDLIAAFQRCRCHVWPRKQCECVNSSARVKRS